jgi:hypothetical protein
MHVHDVAPNNRGSDPAHSSNYTCTYHTLVPAFGFPNLSWDTPIHVFIHVYSWRALVWKLKPRIIWCTDGGVHVSTSQLLSWCHMHDCHAWVEGRLIPSKLNLAYLWGALFVWYPRVNYSGQTKVTTTIYLKL